MARALADLRHSLPRTPLDQFALHNYHRLRLRYISAFLCVGSAPHSLLHFEVTPPCESFLLLLSLFWVH